MARGFGPSDCGGDGGRRTSAEAADVSRGVVARIEQGHADRVTVATLERVAAALDARSSCRLGWNGEGLDRLLDADHAAIVEQVVRDLLRATGWVVATEVSFNVYGERGSIDVLAFHPPTRVVLVVEVKSVVPDIQATLATLDRKVRLALGIARERGWSGGRGVSDSWSSATTEPRDAGSRSMPRRSAARFPIEPRVIRRWLHGPGSDVPASRASGFCQVELTRSRGSAFGRPRQARERGRERRDPDNRSSGGRYDQGCAR